MQKIFLSKTLYDEDIISRFAFHTKDIRANGKIKSSSFKPRSGEHLSVFEVTDLEHDEICEHGRRHVDNPKIKREHIGYGLFQHATISELGLKTIYDNDPPRHVSVVFPHEGEKIREIAKYLEAAFIDSKKDGKEQFFHFCKQKMSL